MKKKNEGKPVLSDDERRKLVSTQSSLAMAPEPRIPAAVAGIAGFSLTEAEEKPRDYSDADSFFNLPDARDDEDEDDNLVR